MYALGMVGGGVQLRGRVPPSGVVEAVVSGQVGHVGNLATQDHNAAQETETTSDPAGIQGEAKRHQMLLFVSTDGEPDG